MMPKKKEQGLWGGQSRADKAGEADRIWCGYMYTACAVRGCVRMYVASSCSGAYLLGCVFAFAYFAYVDVYVDVDVSMVPF